MFEKAQTELPPAWNSGELHKKPMDQSLHKNFRHLVGKMTVLITVVFTKCTHYKLAILHILLILNPSYFVTQSLKWELHKTLKQISCYVCSM